jgi:hypothetical protein
LGGPKDWEEKEFSVENLPTYYGDVSYSYDPHKKTVTVSLDKTTGRECEIISCLPFDVQIIKE